MCTIFPSLIDKKRRLSSRKKHPVVFIKQGTTPTNGVRKFIMSKVAELPQCLLVMYWLSTSFMLVYVHHVPQAHTCCTCCPLHYKVCKVLW